MLNGCSPSIPNCPLLSTIITKETTIGTNKKLLCPSWLGPVFSKKDDVGQIRTDAPEGTRFLVLRDNHSATTPRLLLSSTCTSMKSCQAAVYIFQDCGLNMQAGETGSFKPHFQPASSPPPPTLSLYLKTSRKTLTLHTSLPSSMRQVARSKFSCVAKYASPSMRAISFCLFDRAKSRVVTFRS